MADNPRYSDTGIGYSGAASTPGVDPIGMRAKAQMTGDISGLLDRMAGSLYKVAAEEAQREGLQWGAANPVSMEQLNAAVAAGKDPLAERYTYFGRAQGAGICPADQPRRQGESRDGERPRHG